jgi:hypothetical protein
MDVGSLWPYIRNLLQYLKLQQIFKVGVFYLKSFKIDNNFFFGEGVTFRGF